MHYIGTLQDIHPEHKIKEVSFHFSYLPDLILVNILKSIFCYQSCKCIFNNYNFITFFLFYYATYFNIKIVFTFKIHDFLYKCVYI